MFGKLEQINTRIYSKMAPYTHHILTDPLHPMKSIKNFLERNCAWAHIEKKIFSLIFFLLFLRILCVAFASLQITFLLFLILILFRSTHLWRSTMSLLHVRTYHIYSVGIHSLTDSMVKLFRYDMCALCVCVIEIKKKWDRGERERKTAKDYNTQRVSFMQ